MMKNEYIVFACEHYNPLGLIRSLGESEINPIAIVIKGDPKLTSNSRYIKKLYEVESIEDGFELLLNNYGKSENKDFLFSADDKTETYFDSHFDELKDRFYFFNAGKPNRIARYMNKDNINKLALKHGLNVLPTYVTRKGEIPADIEYPVITKSIASTVGAWKKDVFICNNEKELNDAYNKMESPTVLLQKYINKKNEYCMEGFSVNHGKDMMITIVSNYNYILKDQYSPYMTVKNFDRLEILPNLKGMIKEVGYEGIFEIEFLMDDNEELYFLEINFRNSTWSYASTCVGMPLPVLWSKYIISGNIDKSCYKTVPPKFIAMVEPQDFKVRVNGRQTNILFWFIDFCRADCKYFLGKNDIKPFAYLIKRKIKRIFKLG